MNKSIVIFGILCAGFASASGYLWQEMRAQRERADALQDQIAELSSQPKAQPATLPSSPTTEPEITAATTQVTQAPVTVARTASMQAASAVNAGSRKRVFNGFEQQQRLLRDPEYRKVMLAQQRRSMSMSHPDLKSALGLSREQTDHLFDLLAEQQIRSLENAQSMTDPPDQAALQEMERQVQEQQRNTEAEVASLLGDAKMAEWKEYRQTIGARYQVNELRATLAGGDSALRQDQIQPLVAAIAQEQRRIDTDGGYIKLLPAHPTTENRARMLEESIERTAASHQRIHDAAASILSSDQLDSLDEMLNQNLDMQRVQVRMMRARGEAEVLGEAPTEASMSVVVSSGFVAVEP